MNLILVQTSLEFIGREPVGRVFVIQPPPECRLIIRVILAAKLKQERGHFRLLRSGKRNQFLFQIHDTHVLHLIFQLEFRKRELRNLEWHALTGALKGEAEPVTTESEQN
jgi:hypothetical protein